MTRYAKPAAAGAALATGLLIAGAAWAHHSFAMFDMAPENAVQLEGEVARFDFRNPHAFIYVEVPGEDGAEPVTWAIEMNSPNNLTRQGWSRHTLAAGDQVTVEASPLFDGEPGGLFRWVLKADGTFIVAGSARGVTPPPGVQAPE